MSKNFFFLRTPDGVFKSGESRYILSGIHPGFVIAPFDTDVNQIVTIPIAGNSLISSNLNNNTPNKSFSFPQTSQLQHCKMVTDAIEMAKRCNGKCIVSTITNVKLQCPVDSIRKRLEDKYPDACVFYFNTEQTGMWIGASPELLLSADGKYIHTMALAGTRPVDSSEQWDEKNINEQKIVVDYIANTLRQHNLHPEIGKTITKKAASVEHICTSIRAVIPYNWSMLELCNLLMDISPTPALGGYPKQEAMQFIRNHEMHDRGYYGGFFGILESEKQFQLFVNLRSGYVNLDKTEIALFAGGGITAQSVPIEEWEETRRKVKTMADIIS